MTTGPIVSETFFSLAVADMERAKAFYVRAFGASVLYASPGWTSLKIAGVRIGLALVAGREGTPTGIHFAVPDLATVCRAIAAAGGKVPRPRVEVAPGVVNADVADTEGNGLTLTQR